MKISRDAPIEPISNFTIGIVGHPSFNSAIDPFPKYFGFGNEFGIKRFSPGFIKLLGNKSWRGQEVMSVLHDATTLSGSSGSCVFELNTMKAVGLHFGGWPMQRRTVDTGSIQSLAELFYANGAVPLWTLKDDSFFLGVNFY